MPTYQYRLNIRDPDNGNSHNVGMTDPLKQMRPFAVAGNGGCLEAQFSALTTSMDIKPRSIVTLETNTDGAGWVPRYKGVAVVPGAARSFYPSNVKLAPMKKRFYEKAIPALKVTGGDVAAMVRSVLSVAGNRPAGTVYNAAEIPDLSLSLGDRYTFGLETVGDFLDAMAAVCPADGASPAVTWDVYPDGTIFFKRVNTSRTYTVGTGGVKVKWKEIDAEDVCTKVFLLLADKMSPQFETEIRWTTPPSVVSEYIAKPITHLFDSGNSYDASKVIPFPLDVVLQKITLSVGGVGGYNDPENAIDVSLSTFAESDGATNSGGANYGIGTDLELFFIARIRYEYTPTSPIDEFGFLITHMDYPGLDSVQYSKLKLEPTTEAPKIIFAICPLAMELDGLANKTNFFFTYYADVPTASHIKIHNVEAFRIDPALAERIAKSHIKLPAQEAAEVIVPGIETPVTRLTLTGYGTYNVAAVEYGPDKDSADGGMQTIFKLEQADDPELTGQSSLIKQADSKATMQAIQFQRRG
jgi:hypothetical protein